MDMDQRRMMTTDENKFIEIRNIINILYNQ